LLSVWLSLKRREVAGSRQRGFALMIGGDGERTRAWKKLLCEPVPPVLVESKKSRNACDSDTQLRGSPPGRANESVMPTEALMRTHGTRRVRRRGNTGNFGKARFKVRVDECDSVTENIHVAGDPQRLQEEISVCSIYATAFTESETEPGFPVSQTPLVLPRESGWTGARGQRPGGPSRAV
jgi:hypothetical protein